MKKIKILYLITGLGPGGTEYMLKNIVSKLDKEKYELLVCALMKLTDLVEIIRPFVKRIYILNVKGFSNGFQEFWKLRRIIKYEKPNILHCFLPHANLVGRFAAIGVDCKVISSIRGQFMGRSYLNILDKLTQRLVDLYIVNSLSLKEHANAYGIRENKMLIIENGIDFEKFKSVSTPDRIKRELSISNNIIVTMVAHLRKGKGYPTMLRALAILQKERNDIYFLSVGSANVYDNETQEIMKIVKDLNLKNTKFLGYRTDISDILSITDIWVSGTLFEGQSNSLLEAMAMKKPIITTNIPENSEIVRDGREALLVPINSPLKISQAIKKLIEEKNFANKIAENAYQRVLDKYNLNKTVKKIDKLYELLN